MIHPTQRNQPPIRSILLAGFLIAGLTAGCGDGSPPADGQARGNVRNPAAFQEGLEAVDHWLGRGDAAKAELIAGRMVDLDPGSIEALRAHGRCLLVLGAVEERSGRDDEATELRTRAAGRYRQAVEAAGDTVTASLLHESGIAATAGGGLHDALEFHRRAAMLDESDPTHAIFTANVLTMLERPREAAPWFDRAITIAPEEPWGWAGRAECMRQLERYEEALEAVRTARSRALSGGTDSGLSFRVAEARILRESGRGREAANLLFAVREEEHTRGSTEELAAACTQILEHRRAAEAWERFNQRRPGDTDSMIEAARCWMRQGEPERAAVWLNLAESAGATPAQLDSIRGVN